MTRWTLHALAPLALTAAAVPAAAQTPAAATPARVGTIVGQVLAEGSGAPIIGAQVVVVGTTIGAMAGAEGRFTVRNVPAGTHVVRAQFIGFAPALDTVTVAAGGTATATFRMKDTPYAIAPVVTTALGITRSEKSLGYATTTISAQTLERVPETTMMQALAGQSAGVQVTSASGRPGAGARVSIRGETSFSGNTQPLFVVDGVPISTNTSGPSNALSTGSSGSRQMDIDMENIEEMSVLRGAAATALYGSRGANGVIVIRTKRGKAGQPLRFDFTTEARVDRPILGGYVTEWAAGSRGYFCNGRLPSQGGWCEPGFPGTNSETRENWGPHIDSLPQVVLDSLGGSLRFRDARADFYRTAPTLNSSLRGSGSIGETGTYTFGTSYLDQQGINPAAELNRLNLNANINLKFSSWLTSTTSIQRIRSDNPYSDDSFDGIDKQLIDTPPTTDVREGWMPDGSPVLYGANTPHYDWLAQNQTNSELTNRWIASQQFDLRLGSLFRLTNNWGLDTYVSEYNRFLNERPWRTAQGLASGATQQRKTTETTINNDLQLVMEGREIGRSGVSVSALLGGNLYMRDNAYVQGSGTDIVIPDYYNVTNFVTQRTEANLPTKRRIVGAYTQLTADYQDWAFLSLTGRQDRSSTLPTDNNTYFYPSASLGVVITDALKMESRWLDYAKVRVSRAKVGNDAPPFSLSTRYVTGTVAKAGNNSIQQNGGPPIQFPFRGVTSYTQATQLGNPDLRPESTIEDEVGLELRFFSNRLRVDASAYRKSSYDQIFNIPSSAVTGYTNITRNAGDLRNQGVELSVGGRALEIGSFSWDARANWAQNRSKALSLAPGVTSIFLSGFAWPQVRIMEGQPYGVIWGYGWKRNCVEPNPCHANAPAGAKLIGADGFPIRTDELRNLGNVMPNWIGSFTSEFRYKSLMLSGLVDVRSGGKIINFQTQYEAPTGRSVFTRDRNTWTTEEGVSVTTGQPNTTRVFKNREYYNLMYGFDRHEAHIEPAGFVKLRELTLSFRVPRSAAQRVGADDASVFVTGRNLRVWSDFSLGDPEGDVYGGTNAGGQYFRWFNEPQTRSFVAGFRTAF